MTTYASTMTDDELIDRYEQVKINVSNLEGMIASAEDYISPGLTHGDESRLKGSIYRQTQRLRELRSEMYELESELEARGLGEGLEESNLILTLGEFRRIIREAHAAVVEENHQKLVRMYSLLGQRIKALSINSDDREKQYIRQAILDFPDPQMAERLSNFLQHKLQRLETAFSHVGTRRPVGRRREAPVASRDRVRRAG